MNRSPLADPYRPQGNPKQQAELARMHATGRYNITNLTEVFSVSRPTVYRTLQRHRASSTDNY